MTDHTSFSETVNHSAEHEQMPESIKKIVCSLQRVCAMQRESSVAHMEPTLQKDVRNEASISNINNIKIVTVAELLHNVQILTNSYQHLVEIAVDSLKWPEREESKESKIMLRKDKEPQTNCIEEMEKELTNFKLCVASLQTGIRSKSSQTIRFAILQELIAENEYRRRAVDQMRKVLEVARAIEENVEETPKK